MLKIGVTGHRDLKNSEGLRNAVREVLLNIYQLSISKSFQIFSSLAEGADRLVVWQALESFPVSLIVALPMKEADYSKDFSGEESQVEFVKLMQLASKTIEMPSDQMRPEVYLTAGEYVLNYSDVLIALWDGEKSRGLGSTENIVSRARAAKKPMAWVRAYRNEDDYKIAPLINSIQYERFPAQFR